MRFLPTAANGRVAVIIPTYNRAQFLPRAIASVQRQTMAERCDIIVIDDGSTDDTPSVVERCGPQVRYVWQPNGGAAAARNTGIRGTPNEFIAFLDSDDEWEPDKIERQLAVFEAWPEVVLVTGGALARGADGRTCVRVIVPRGVPRNVPFDAAPFLFADNFMPTPTVMVRRAVLERTGLFEEGLRRRHDYHLWVRVACVGPVVFLGALLARYDVDNADGLSRDRESCLEHKLRARRLLRRELRTRPDCRGVWHRGMAACLASLRDHSYRDRRFTAALGYGVRSLYHQPLGRPRWEWGRLAACAWGSLKFR